MGLVTPGHKLVRTRSLDTEDTGVITTQIRTHSSPRHFMGTPDPAWHCPGHGLDKAHINMYDNWDHWTHAFQILKFLLNTPSQLPYISHDNHLRSASAV